jgi:hypothetical protein
LQRVLDTLTEKNFQEALKKWRRRWNQCLHAGGNYFELFWGWWQPIGLMVSFIIFTASVRNILDSTTYALVLEATAPTVFMVWL